MRVCHRVTERCGRAAHRKDLVRVSCRWAWVSDVAADGLRSMQRLIFARHGATHVGPTLRIGHGCGRQTRLCSVCLVRARTRIPAADEDAKECGNANDQSSLHGKSLRCLSRVTTTRCPMSCPGPRASLRKSTGQALSHRERRPVHASGSQDPRSPSVRPRGQCRHRRRRVPFSAESPVPRDPPVDARAELGAARSAMYAVRHDARGVLECQVPLE